MKLSQRNGKGSGVYGAHLGGLDFHVTPYGRGWHVVVRRLVETAGVVHSLGQPDLFQTYETRLKDIRDALEGWDESDRGPVDLRRWNEAGAIGARARWDREDAKSGRS